LSRERTPQGDLDISPITNLFRDGQTRAAEAQGNRFVVIHNIKTVFRHKTPSALAKHMSEIVGCRTQVALQSRDSRICRQCNANELDGSHEPEHHIWVEAPRERVIGHDSLGSRVLVVARCDGGGHLDKQRAYLVREALARRRSSFFDGLFLVGVEVLVTHPRDPR
jgi:hypothetical protein